MRGRRATWNASTGVLASGFLATWLLAVSSVCHSAPGGQVIVDMAGVDPSIYAMDLEDCRDYAGQVSMPQRVGVAAAGGAAVGAAFGAIFGSVGGAANGAAGGGVYAGAAGGLEANRERRQVLRNCLRGRGYRVLN